MEPRLVRIGFFASPLVAIAIFALRLDSFANVYFLSVALGLVAYTYLCNELLLVYPPRWLNEAFGADRLKRTQAGLAIAILALAAFHGALKTGLLFAASSGDRPGAFFPALFYALGNGLGFTGKSSHALLGKAALGGLVLLGILGALRASKSSLTRLKIMASIRMKIGERLRPSAAAERVLRVALGLIGILVLAHLASASSTAWSSNPVGASFLFCYTLLCLAVFARGLYVHGA